MSRETSHFRDRIYRHYEITVVTATRIPSETILWYFAIWGVRNQKPLLSPLDIHLSFDVYVFSDDYIRIRLIIVSCEYIDENKLAEVLMNFWKVRSPV